ncbi:MAG: BREX-1 system adenine-specific DNA-methyltransferase PglX, partial [Desulfobacterales bacterium]|nr:BREX-1 system adenine-specific DNA-methyltransferase PglX [Desulfobacterales bacterium]
QLLDLLEQRYDVVATNPPYMLDKNFGKNILEYIKNNYPKKTSDLYVAFILRNIDLLDKSGYLAMITQQTFMFLPTYKSVREKILTAFEIRTLSHLGPHSFEDIGGEKVSTAMFCFKHNKKINEIPYQNIFFNSTHCENADSKNRHLLKSINNNNNNLKCVDTYTVFQDHFKIIESYPIVYWVNPNIRDLFKKLDKFDSKAQTKQGLSTGDNDRYIRYWWENSLKNFNKRWFCFAKGGEYSKWYGNLDLVIDWENNGFSIKNFIKSGSGAIRNEKFYFKEGITYSRISGKGFNCRYLPENCIFDSAGTSIFPNKDINRYFILGFLNSELCDYFLKSINPSLVFQVGDVSRIPFKEPKSENLIIIRDVSNLASQCVNIKKDALKFMINDLEFKQTAIQWGIKMGN